MSTETPPFVVLCRVVPPKEEDKEKNLHLVYVRLGSMTKEAKEALAHAAVTTLTVKREDGKGKKMTSISLIDPEEAESEIARFALTDRAVHVVTVEFRQCRASTTVTIT